MRDVVLLGTACAAGIAIAPGLPVVGLPMSAAAAAGLAFRGRRGMGVFALALGVAIAAVMSPAAVAYAAAGAVAVLLAVTLVPSRSLQLVGAGVAALVAAGAVSADALLARANGTTLAAAVHAQANASMKLLQQAVGTGTDWADGLETARRTIVLLWPSLYFQTAIWTAIFVIVAVGWAARRSGVEIAIPKNRDVDLSGHVLWGLVGGLVLLAAAPFVGEYAGAARAVSYNTLFVVRTLFFVQGLAVFSAVFKVPETGAGKMVGLYAILWIADQFLLVVSLIGMLDFWVNFRRLPRDGSPAPARLEEPPASV